MYQKDNKPILIEKVYSILIDKKLIEDNPVLQERIEAAVVMRNAELAQQEVPSSDEYDSSDYDTDSNISDSDN